MFGSALWVCDAVHLEFLVMLGCSCVNRFSEFIVLRVVEDLFLMWVLLIWPFAWNVDG